MASIPKGILLVLVIGALTMPATAAAQGGGYGGYGNGGGDPYGLNQSLAEAQRAQDEENNQTKLIFGVLAAIALLTGGGFFFYET